MCRGAAETVHGGYLAAAHPRGLRSGPSPGSPAAKRPGTVPSSQHRASGRRQMSCRTTERYSPDRVFAPVRRTARHRQSLRDGSPPRRPVAPEPGAIVQRLPPRRGEADPITQLIVFHEHTVVARPETLVERDQQPCSVQPLLHRAASYDSASPDPSSVLLSPLAARHSASSRDTEAETASLPHARQTLPSPLPFPLPAIPKAGTAFPADIAVSVSRDSRFLLTACTRRTTETAFAGGR